MRTMPAALIAIALAGVLLRSPPARAEERTAVGHVVRAEPSSERATEVTLAAALRLAANRGPELGPARAGVAGARELEAPSRTLVTRPAELALSAGPRFGVDRGLDATIQLLQPIALGGVGSARSRVAQARRSAAAASLADARARSLLAAASTWVNARLARELMRVREASLDEAGALLAIANARLASGAATAGEVALVRSLVGAARAALLDAEGQRFAADAELGYETGLDPETLEATGPLDDDGPEVTEAEALAAAERLPRLRYLRAEASTLDASAEQARAEGAPYLAVGPSFTREGTGDMVLLGHVNVPLPFVNPNGFEAAERGRLARVAHAETERERARTRVDTLIALHERAHARLTRDALARDALVPARDGLSEAMLRYREGKAPLSDVLAARRGLIEVEERRLAASAAARLAELRLLSALGRLDVESP